MYMTPLYISVTNPVTTNSWLNSNAYVNVRVDCHSYCAFKQVHIVLLLECSMDASVMDFALLKMVELKIIHVQ